jgi:serine phosphatase RsbU (regulator of sigma subunit)
MSPEKPSSRRGHHWIYFTLALIVIVTVYVFYVVNMVRWRNSPDFGWRTMYGSGPNVVAQVLERAKSAGLRVGDKILAINGKEYRTFDELYFKVRNNEPGSVNTYIVIRDGETTEISITTGRIGIRAVMWRSGAVFVIGLLYVTIGVLVFLMKPHAEESWLFLVMTSLIGMHISYAAPSDLMDPLWLFEVRLFIGELYKAPIIHLALRFPRKHKVLEKWPWVWIVPYLLSIVHFVLYEMTIEYYWDPAPVLDLIGKLYLIIAVLIFLASMVWNFLKDLSLIIRRQSQVILLGIALGFAIPTTDLLLRNYWGTYLFPEPTLGFVVFLFFFPLSIGYTIVKHDLFAIDLIIKRTYGYVLTTGAVAGIYALFVLASNLVFGKFEVTKSPVFPVIFILAVLFFFNPVRNRVQKFIDRVFYRLEYDYQETVQKISETMRSLMNLNEITKAMMDTALGTMFIDTGSLMLLNPKKETYECFTLVGEREPGRVVTEKESTPAGERELEKQESEEFRKIGTEEQELWREAESEKDLGLSDMELQASDPLIKKIAERKKEVTIYDIESDPFYEEDKDAYKRAFYQMQATLLVPLIYEDRLTGLISLGEKKSGKFYRSEDINLLKTLANQGAVAIENAKLMEEVIEKERMEEELAIAHDLQTSMLPATCPEIEGFQIAALSTPAREVGGDFYDFIQIGDGRAGFVIGDVTGKSVSGALVMSASRSVFRMLSEEGLTVGEIMIRANRRIKKDIKSGMFVALLYAVLNSRDRILKMCSAGQTQPIHVSSTSGEVSLVETEGDTFPLGILDDTDYQETQLKLAAGDKVIFYTDGIVEAMNEQEELFGFERLINVVQGVRYMDADSLLKAVLNMVNEFVGGAAQHDDLTVIVVSAGE